MDEKNKLHIYCKRIPLLHVTGKVWTPLTVKRVYYYETMKGYHLEKGQSIYSTFLLYHQKPQPLRFANTDLDQIRPHWVAVYERIRKQNAVGLQPADTSMRAFSWLSVWVAAVNYTEWNQRSYGYNTERTRSSFLSNDADLFYTWQRAK